VTAYTDTPSGTMNENADGSGEFTRAVLRPWSPSLDAAMREKAESSRQGREALLIARSVNFPVHHQPAVVVDPHTETCLRAPGL